MSGTNPKLLICGPVEYRELLQGDARQPVGISTMLASDIGLDPVIVTLSDQIDEPLERYFSWGNLIALPLVRTPRKRLLTLYSKETQQLTSLINDIGPSLVHAHWPYEYALGALSTKSRVLVSLHDSPLDLYRANPSPGLALRLTMAGLAAKKSSFVSVVSPFLNANWKTLSGWIPQFLLPNSIDMANEHPLTPLGRVSPRERGSEVKLISVGHAHANKNMSVLAGLLDALKLSRYSISLKVFGAGLEPGGHFDRLHGLTKAGAELFGHVTPQELDYHLTTTDVLIIPSIIESFSLTALKAMKLGIPVIHGKSAGGISWVVSNPSLGSDVRDPSDIAETLISLIESPQRFSNASSLSIQRAWNFSHEVVRARYASILERLVH